MTIVFVHGGPHLPEYISDATTQASMFTSGPIYLLAERKALAGAPPVALSNLVAVATEDLSQSPVHQKFREVSRLDTGFRDGFWTHTTERFFYLSSLAEKYRIENGIHVESDVLLYTDLDHLSQKLGNLYSGIAVPFDNDDRAQASILFWRRPESLASFCDFIVDQMQQNPQEYLNDMILLARARQRLGPSVLDALPILPADYKGPLRSVSGRSTHSPGLFSNHAEALGCIFDAVAIGQYFGGPDPRNFAVGARRWYQPPRTRSVPPPPGAGFVNESALFDPRTVQFTWLSDPAGRRAPFLAADGRLVPIANLHIHGKDLKTYLSSAPDAPVFPIASPLVPAEEMISSERIQSIADVTVTTTAKLAVTQPSESATLAIFEPGWSPDEEPMAALRDARVIFVYSELIEGFIERVLPNLENPFVLITHDGDHRVEERFRAALDSPKILHWFGQNVEFRHPKLTAVPIGIANSRWPHGNTDAVAREAARGAPKRPWLYVNFDIGTNRKVRGPILDVLATRDFAVMGRRRRLLTYARQWWASLRGKNFVDKGRPKPFADYLAEMSKWQFAVSPPGNGIDCHRTWEALYLGVIPVASPAPGDLFDDLPIIVIEDFGNLTMADLLQKMDKLRGPFAWQKLRLSYWREQIHLAASESTKVK